MLVLIVYCCELPHFLYLPEARAFEYFSYFMSYPLLHFFIDEVESANAIKCEVYAQIDHFGKNQSRKFGVKQ